MLAHMYLCADTGCDLNDLSCINYTYMIWITGMGGVESNCFIQHLCYSQPLLHIYVIYLKWSCWHESLKLFCYVLSHCNKIHSITTHQVFFSLKSAVPVYLALFIELFFIYYQLTMNDFSVHRIIGRGGFGEVYGCRKADTGKMYVGYTYNIIPWLHLVWFDLAHCVLFLLHSLLGCSTVHTFWVCSLKLKKCGL